MNCSICKGEMGEMHYAIRDMKPNETYFEWLGRHVVCLFAFGLKSRKHATIIPVCDECAQGHLACNIAGRSEHVA
jgi:hypothetical protein